MKASLIAAVLLTLSTCPVAVSQQPGGVQMMRHRLALPSEDWALEALLPVSPSIIDLVSVDGLERQFYAHIEKEKKASLVLIVHLAPAQVKGGGPSRFRTFALNRMKSKDSDPQTFEHGQIPVAKYLINLENFFGFGSVASMVPPLNKPAPALSAFLVHDDTWIELQMWGKSIIAADEAMFYSVLDSIKFIDTSAPATSYDFLQKGRPFFLQKNYASAAEFYAKALELERIERRFAIDSWRTLILEAADVFGANRDAQKAKETLLYGISQDETYPLFHYHLARLYAGLGDLDNTIASLNRAFLNKGNVPLPKPAEDEPFERFRKDERFRKAVRGMKP